MKRLLLIATLLLFDLWLVYGTSFEFWSIAIIATIAALAIDWSPECSG